MMPPSKKVPAIEVKPRAERDILRAPQRSGFVRRLVLNDPIRIEELEDLGYRVVEAEDGGPLTRREYVVMEIPQDLYDARQAEKVAEVKRSRETLSRTARREPEQAVSQSLLRDKAQILGGVEIEGGS